MKKQRGITLVALVITIIVLLILASVTINLTLGERGIFRTAQVAAQNYKDTAQDELFGLNSLQNEINDTIGKLGQTSKIVLDGSWSTKNKVNMPKAVNTGLTPVAISDSGEYSNVDIQSENWYSYDGTTNKWANAKTQDGSMWVWIPRFAYKINSSSKTIDVVFLKDKTNLDANGNDVTSASYVDEKGVAGAYIVHPAFQNGSSNNYANGEWRAEIPGFWMAKFEAGYQDADKAVDSNIGLSTVYSWTHNFSTNQGSASNLTTNYYGTRAVGTKIKYPTFTANKPSMNYIPVADSFDLCKTFASSGNPYGLSNIDSHLTKNSEWGAVAYLTHSKYGRNGTEVTINNININNSTATIYAVTGYGASSVSANYVTATLAQVQNGSLAGSWTTSQGQKASSTGNMYGIYDLSGGLWEWTAGYIIPSTDTTNYNTYGGSLKGQNNEYVSKYAGTTATDTTNYNTSPNPSRKGEAIWETSTSGTGSNSWNGDYSYFLCSTRPFSIRGGSFNNGTSAGVFAFYRSHGYCNCGIGFRAVLVAE